MRHYVLAITGASGACYTRKVAACLIESQATVHLIVSPAGRKLLAMELGVAEPAELLGTTHERLVVLSGYSLTKRWTCLCHFVLGLADGLAPLAAWIAISPSGAGLPAVELLLAMAFWIGGFDILYALADRELDIRLGLHSLPVALGPARAVWVSRLCHAAALGLLAAVACNERGVLGGLYLAALAVAAGVLLWQHKTLRPESPSAMERVFFIGNALVGTLVGAAGIIDALI